MSAYWPAGMPRSLEYPDLTVGKLNAAAAQMYGERVAVVDGDERVTYLELHRRASVLANALRANGVQDGGVVVLHQPNSLWFLVSYYGALLAGATVALTNPLQPVRGLHAQLLDTAAAVAITHPAHADTMLHARTDSSVQTVVVVPASTCAPADRECPAAAGVVPYETFVDGHHESAPTVGVAPDDVAHLAYTGGTTGVSKAVRVLHRNVVANVVQMVAWRSAHLVATEPGRDCVLRPIEGVEDAGVVPGTAVSVLVAPFFHAHALIHTNFLLLGGATLVLSGRFSPESMLESIERHRGTYVTGSPAMWQALLDSPDIRTRDLSSVQVMSSGAAPIDRTTLESLQSVFPSAMIMEGYGLTEGTCLVTSAPALRSARRKLGSVGIPAPDTAVEIRPVDGGRERLGPNQTGELWVRGPQVADGYHAAPEATAEQFVDGWLRTGDIAYQDEEGFLYIADRAKDMLIYKGYNVYPRELEEVLLSHPDVTLAAVVGRTVGSAGQEPVAFVVPRRGRRVDTAELMSFVAERVLPYKKIRDVQVLDELPTSAAGKILKTELRDRVGRCQGPEKLSKQGV